MLVGFSQIESPHNNNNSDKFCLIFRLLVQDVLSVNSHYARIRLRGSLEIAVRAFISGLDPKPIHSSLFFLSLVARTEFCPPFSLLNPAQFPSPSIQSFQPLC